jgi:hypothetical protein
MSRALAARIRRLEKALDIEQAETLEEIVRASFLKTQPFSDQDVAKLDAACLASLKDQDIPRGRAGWLIQLVLRARGGRLVAEGAALT